MKTRNLVLSIATIACFGTTTAAFAEDEWVDVYGKIIMTLDKVDEDNGDKQSELNSNASRFGIKGHGAAGDDLEVFYQLEWEVDLADNADDNIKSRNQIIGLRGGFGEVFAGRHDTPTKKLQKKIDLFNDLSGDIKRAFNGETRASNIVQYSTPKMRGFKAKLAIVPGEETDNNDNLADGTSVAVEYRSGQLNLGASFDADINGEGVDTARVMAQYKMSGWQFGVMVQRTDNNGLDGDGYMASVKYTSGKNSYKLQLADSDIWQAGVSSKVKYSSQVSLGVDHKLSKYTSVFVYTTLSEEGATDDDDSIYGIGIEHKF